MSLSVLDIIKSFCYETNISAPSTVVPGSVTDPGTNQLIYLFYAVCRDLRERKCWPQLKKTYSFNTAASDSAYALPTDFYSALLGTAYDTTRKWQLDGPQTDENMDYYLYGYAYSSGRMAYRIFGKPGVDQFQVTPTPSSILPLTFDYVSSGYLGTGASPYTWSEIIVADNDICAFDDDLVILGLKWRWYQMKGLDFESLKAEYEGKIDQAVNRFNGSYRGSFNRYPRGNRRFVPSTPGGWSY